MDDLERLFSQSYEARAADLPAPSDHLLVAVSDAVASRRRARVIGTVAAVAVPIAAIGAFALLRPDGAGHDPAATPSPSASSSPTASSSPAPTAVATGWDGVPESERPPVLDQAQPGQVDPVRAMEGWVWDYVDDSWSLTVGRDSTDASAPPYAEQVLYLDAPDGDVFRLASLGTDRYVDFVATDLGARLAWLSWADAGDAVQVVQYDLVTGDTVEDWGGDAIPAGHVNGDGSVWSVYPTGSTTPLGEIWAGRTYLGEYDSLFVRTGGATFQQLAAQSELNGLVAAGARNGSGDPGVTAWHAPDWSYAVFLAQERDPGATPEDWTAATGAGEWLVVDLTTGESRRLGATLPSTFCAPVLNESVTDMAVIDGGSYEAPGPIPATCDGGSANFWLHAEEGVAATPR
ncbi:hypothetical protein [Demequina capsici]|uniref:Uncharacterized protein n=1 Tax=Demequina capsici TaxID=3075620 RepID=A0AA96F6W9_9MICO|nr:hypothetical protein [Demequina sp. OYTSA14]WNM24637.1 hypothetical protein RN606_00365 [Demequina sp. OYTSA14]